MPVSGEPLLTFHAYSYSGTRVVVEPAPQWQTLIRITNKDWQ